MRAPGPRVRKNKAHRRPTAIDADFLGKVNPKKLDSRGKTIHLADTQSRRSSVRKNPARRISSVTNTAAFKKFKSKEYGGKQMINQYRVERALGKGSFATVYLCTLTSNNT